MFTQRKLPHPDDRDPLRVMFVITCMPVGGAETLLVNLVRRMDRDRFSPELCCLKYFGPLGEVLSQEIPAFTGLLAHKYDFAVFNRLTRLLRERRADAVVTVGTGGDKMFWGRLAAWRARCPVVLSALHSTGLPDHVELPNRLLAPLTDGFIAVAKPHGEYLVRSEGCPRRKVFVIPNGVDTTRFRPQLSNAALRAELGLAPDDRAVTIVAALRPEKNHELFLHAARRVKHAMPNVKFLIVGDGEQRRGLEALALNLQVADVVRFLGTRSDIPAILAETDVVALTSHMEANPVSIIEALACEKPVVATRVGSVPETVVEGQTGYLVTPGDEKELKDRLLLLLRDRALSARLGAVGRERVLAGYSLDRMVHGYENLIRDIYLSKCRASRPRTTPEDRSATKSPSLADQP